MEPWISHPTRLTGQTVSLIPLEESHLDTLIPLANDKRIWEFGVYDGTDPVKMRQVLASALREREAGTQYPFAIVYNDTQSLIGSTRLMDLQPQHRKLEIGATWLQPAYWGTAVNLECKLLLLTFSFETLKTIRVQWKTDVNNIRSRTAIQKVGGRFEGILRCDMLRDNGTRRDSAYFSLLDEEWAENKVRLTAMYETRKGQGVPLNSI